MTIRDEFEASELAQAKLESEARLKRVADYKVRWRHAKRDADPEAFKALVAKNMREWRAKNRDRAREISRKGTSRYNADNPATKRMSARQYNQKRRREICDFFGGKCVRCGFDDIRSLQMDHINGDGAVMRKNKTLNNLHSRAKFLRDSPEMARKIYQLLCANCNWIKREENYEYSRSARLRKAAGVDE